MTNSVTYTMHEPGEVQSLMYYQHHKHDAMRQMSAAVLHVN